MTGKSTNAYCPTCGTHLGGAAFCPKCQRPAGGTPDTAGNSPSDGAEKKKRWRQPVLRVLKWIGLVVLTLGVLFGLACLRDFVVWLSDHRAISTACFSPDAFVQAADGTEPILLLEKGIRLMCASTSADKERTRFEYRWDMESWYRYYSYPSIESRRDFAQAGELIHAAALSIRDSRRQWLGIWDSEPQKLARGALAYWCRVAEANGDFDEEIARRWQLGRSIKK